MRAKLLVVLPFAIFIAIIESVEYSHLWAIRSAPIQEGDVVRREKFSSWGIPRGRMTIKLVDEDTIVVAETNQQFMRESAARVRFRYNGDANREVFIEGEEEPLWVALFMWVLSLGIIVFCVIPLLQRSSPLPVAEDMQRAPDDD